MAGETNLAWMLASLDVERRDGSFTFVTGDHPSLGGHAVATIVEAEGMTTVVDVDVARAAGLAVDFEAAWLTLTVASALEAVGLTAAFSSALADAGIACNVLAGFHHDHLLVPIDRVDEAVAVLRSLSDA